MASDQNQQSQSRQLPVVSVTFSAVTVEVRMETSPVDGKSLPAVQSGTVSLSYNGQSLKDLIAEAIRRAARERGGIYFNPKTFWKDHILVLEGETLLVKPKEKL